MHPRFIDSTPSLVIVAERVLKIKVPDNLIKLITINFINDVIIEQDSKKRTNLKRKHFADTFSDFKTFVDRKVTWQGDKETISILEVMLVHLYRFVTFLMNTRCHRRNDFYTTCYAKVVHMFSFFFLWKEKTFLLQNSCLWKCMNDEAEQPLLVKQKRHCMSLLDPRVHNQSSWITRENFCLKNKVWNREKSYQAVRFHAYVPLKSRFTDRVVLLWLCIWL